MNLKDKIRKDIKRIALERTVEYVNNANFCIFEKLINLDEYRHAKSIFVYYSTNSEVDTTEIIIKALADNKRVSIPKIVGDKIIPIEVTSKTIYKTNKYGIKEPVNGEVVTDVDMCVVPVVAFDRQNGRLGHGAGYYDKYLDEYKGTKIALAFSDQEAVDIPMANLDVYMDKVITEKEIIK